MGLLISGYSCIIEAKQSGWLVIVTSERVQSPCVRRCFLNEADVCLGCFRTLEEICGWNQSSDAQRLEILTQCRQREALYKQQQAERLSHHDRDS